RPAESYLRNRTRAELASVGLHAHGRTSARARLAAIEEENARYTVTACASLARGALNAGTAATVRVAGLKIHARACACAQALWAAARVLTAGPGTDLVAGALNPASAAVLWVGERHDAPSAAGNGIEAAPVIGVRLATVLTAS